MARLQPNIASVKRALSGLIGAVSNTRGGHIFLLLAIGALSAQAEDNTDYIFNGTTVDYPAYSYFLLANSSPGTNNSLQILNGGAVSNDYGSVGNGGGDNFNYAIISGTNSSGNPSTWLNRDRLLVGSLGSFNLLTVTNGGYVQSPRLFMSFGGTAATNTIVVTGSNSLVNLTGGLNDLFVGYSGNGVNQLFISNGGRLNNSVAYVGYGLSAGNNSIFVSGASSVWSSSSSLNLGYNVGGNSLTISSGGRVNSADGTVGFYGNDTVLVTGSNSLWSMPGGLGIGGHNALVTMADGGRIVSSDAYIGNGASSATNVAVVISGTDSRWTLSGDLNVGWIASGTSLTITNGGRADSNRGYIGRFNPSSNNLATVTGSNSFWNITGDLTIGNDGPGLNQLRVVDGGRVKNAVAHIGYGVNASNNSVLVSGTGSVWSNTGSINLGVNAGGNLLVITNGGRVDAADLSIGAFTPNNRLVVTGSDSLLSLNTLGFGIAMGGHNAQVTVSDGGRIINSDGYVGNGLASATNVIAVVTGSGSLWSNTASLNVGWTASKTSVLVTNGGTLHAGQTFVGRLAGSTNNSVIVTGTGSMFQNRLQLVVGTAGAGNGAGNVTVTDGGTVESPVLISGFSGSGTISNRGGIYQFATATPTVTPNTAGSIMMTNGSISYRGVSAADINDSQVANITFQGNNAFRLDNSTNALVPSYKFDSVANTGNPANYQRLVLTNNSRWQSAYLTNGAGGAIKGSAGDVLEISRSLTIQRSANTSAEFDLASSTVLFSGGTGHTNAITGVDFGHNGTNGFPDGFTAVNFSYGRLQLGSTSDHIYFESGDGALSNALYVLNLDLLGSTNHVANLHAAANINVYYGISSLAPGNAYLMDKVYTLDGGGLLLPAIPEPSTLLLLSIAACAKVCRKSRQA